MTSLAAARALSIQGMAFPEPHRFEAGIPVQWLLEPGVTFLNHGSFGAVPRAVFEEQVRWRERIEASPVEIMGRRCAELIAGAKEKIAPRFGMGAADFGLVTNATEGVNAVLRSLSLQPDDELLTTTHVYNAVRQAMQYVCSRTGASYREVDVPLPAASADELASAILSSLSDRTRLLVIDHVTSPTTIVFPIRQIVSGCRERGVEVLVDGAHAPGMLELDIASIGAAYYAGNLHKWCFAPKGSGFLWVRPDKQADVHPLIISHLYGQGLDKEFGWQGTRDLSAWLTIPAALDFCDAMQIAGLREHNHAMAVWAHRLLCDAMDVEPLTPLDGSLLGSMAAMSLPPRLDAEARTSFDRLQQRLYTEFHMEVPLMVQGPRRLLRVSCQTYNVPEDYLRLGEVLKRL